MSGGHPRFGVIRWIGNIPQEKDHLIVGLELVRKGITFDILEFTHSSNVPERVFVCAWGVVSH